MRIAGDGTWFYMGTPIGRPALVRLFSTILKRENGKHFLVTPVEKVGIRVDDAPFLAVEMQKEEGERGRLLRSAPTSTTGCLRRRTSHAIRDGRRRRADAISARPRRLWAKVTRALYYDLVDMGERAGGRWSTHVRDRVRRRILRDGGREAGEGRALNEPMLKTEPAAISSAEFFGRTRARLNFEVPRGLIDPNIIPRTGDSGNDRMLEIVAREQPVRPAAVLIPWSIIRSRPFC
jgi:hypothetical protein